MQQFNLLVTKRDDDNGIFLCERALPPKRLGGARPCAREILNAFMLVIIQSIHFG